MFHFLVNTHHWLEFCFALYLHLVSAIIEALTWLVKLFPVAISIYVKCIFNENDWDNKICSHVFLETVVSGYLTLYFAML